MYICKYKKQKNKKREKNMNNTTSLRFLLHVSDFHLTDDPKHIKHAQTALKALAQKLRSEKIKVDYLVHTGDIIDSSDLYLKAAEALSLKKYIIGNGDNYYFDHKNFVNSEENSILTTFDEKVREFATLRFEKAKGVLEGFISDLNISFGSVIICSGNHDILRPLAISDETFTCTKDKEIWSYHYPEEYMNSFRPFEDFLNKLEVANSQKRCNVNEPVTHCSLDNLNFLILNTNWKNPHSQKLGYFCTNCKHVNKTICELLGESNDTENINIVLAHKPVYEICEKARLAHKRYIKTSFMSNLQKYIGKNGVYFCGDKHTRSIIGSYIHDIPHYISGEPISLLNSENGESEVEYNLLEISQNKFGMERKVHLKYSKSKNKEKWHCEIRPQDTVVSSLYQYSKDHIVRNTFETIAGPRTFNSWESLSQELYSWNTKEREDWYNNLSNLYKSICKYRENGVKDIQLKNENIFSFVIQRIKMQMNNATSENLLNIRGENSSGKSTFLGLLYIYLLNQYSIGKINFIPAYFNLESKEIYSKIKPNGSYHEAVRAVFESFTDDVENIARKEHHSVCYIIDGMDEQDCWSHITEDSVGRCILDILAQYSNSHYIMSFSQQRLPIFKNTMPARKYNDKSDIMYFNPIDIRERGAEDKRFSSFVEAFLKMKKASLRISDNVLSKSETESGTINFCGTTPEIVDGACEVIRQFRRLTINPGFMYQNYNYIVAMNNETKKLQHSNESESDVYGYYIDRQYEICLNKLGYGFVKYAPIMAYLFAYKGYTYEKFKHMSEENDYENKHLFKPIYENFDKVYNTFLFIQKYKDAREYLIALHYNRELRYYAEHPGEDIDEGSILNEFISRNISVIIRKLWSDTNKFIMMCEQLLKRDTLNNCTISTLIYCLAHLQIYAPFRDSLFSKLKDKGMKNFSKTKINDSPDEDDTWMIRESGDNAQKLNDFLNLSLLHSIKIFSTIGHENSQELVKSILDNHPESRKGKSLFQIYNRQYQMLYYGDLSIKGEDKKRPLHPGKDEVNKGFDFHNCFYCLYVKLTSSEKYPLREYDMFTMWDLIYSRLNEKYLCGSDERSSKPNSFFYNEKFSERATMVLEQAKEIFDAYLSNEDVKTEKTVRDFFKEAKECFEKELLSIKDNINL